jgi:hypothetical protein
VDAVGGVGIASLSRLREEVNVLFNKKVVVAVNCLWVPDILEPLDALLVMDEQEDVFLVCEAR